MFISANKSVKKFKKYTGVNVYKLEFKLKTGLGVLTNIIKGESS